MNIYGPKYIEIEERVYRKIAGWNHYQKFGQIQELLYGSINIQDPHEIENALRSTSPAWRMVSSHTTRKMDDYEF